MGGDRGDEIAPLEESRDPSGHGHLLSERPKDLRPSPVFRPEDETLRPAVVNDRGRGARDRERVEGARTATAAPGFEGGRGRRDRGAARSASRGRDRFELRPAGRAGAVSLDPAEVPPADEAARREHEPDREGEKTPCRGVERGHARLDREASGPVSDGRCRRGPGRDRDRRGRSPRGNSPRRCSTPRSPCSGRTIPYRSSGNSGIGSRAGRARAP